MEKLIQDLRYAIRSLLRQPSFALTAILTLSLGIGATAAIFSVVHSVLLRPLPFEEPDRVVAVMNAIAKASKPSQNVSAPDFHDWEAQSRSFEALGYYTGGEWSVTIDGAADYALAFRVTPGFLRALRARAAFGRLLTDEEQRPGGPLAIVLTHDYWTRQFNADPGAIGKTVKFDERIFTITGVLEPSIRFPARADFYYPAWVTPETSSRSGHNYRVIGRLRDGVTIDQARAEMSGIAMQLAQMYPQTNEGKLVSLTPLQELLVGGVRETLLVLFGAVGVVLLIACANVANLLLARSTVRQREMVVRAAVGASRGRLIRQLLTESALLGIAAGLLGVWFARFGVLALIASAPATLPRVTEVRVDAVVLAFSMLIALLASLLFGLAPALHVSRVQLTEGLRQGGKGVSTGTRTGMARSLFVVAEIALAVVLVVGAGLLARSLTALMSVDMGFDADRLLVLRTAVPMQTREEAPRAAALYRDLLADLRTTPGISSAAGVMSIPTQVRSTGLYGIDSGPGLLQSGVNAPQAVLNVVTPDYFKTLRISVRQGRDIGDGDIAGAPMVAVINESLARTSFPGTDPLGRRIQCGLDTLEFMTIVGVVADVRTNGPAAAVQPEIYMPYQQHPAPATSLNIVVRAETGNPLSLVETIRAKIARLNPDVPVRGTTMAGTLESASETPRFRTFLLVVFAAIALVLAVAGVYGVMAYTVNQRVPELGVRVALGATPGNIMRLIVGQGARLAAVGLGVGIVLALLSGRFLEGILFGITATDPGIYFGVVLVVALATLAACYIPGRRAVRVDPMTALRGD
jgi:putative ABC transport system permease protein